MPFEQQWIIPNHVVFVKLSGILTVEEIGASFEMSMDFVDEHLGENPIHFLHDWTELEIFPTSLALIKRSTNRKLKDRSKLGWVVAYSSDQFMLRFISDIVFRIFQVHFRMVENLDQAQMLLQNIDPTLPENFPPTGKTRESHLQA